MEDNIFARLYDRLRIYDWFDKLELIVFSSTLLIIYSGRIFAKELALTLFFMFCLFAYSFALNSVTDKKEDIASGKKRYLGASEKTMRATIIVFLLLTIVVSTSIWLLYKNHFIIILSFICLVLGTLYSARPVRLKGKGILALISTSLFMRVLPFIILTTILQLHSLIVYYLSLWLFLEGFRRGLGHQVKDYRNDVRQKIPTLTTKLGFKQGIRVKTALKLSISTLSLSSLLLFDFWLSVLMIIGMNLFKFRSGPYK